ncbi:MAG: glutamate--tRNA ligase, partial [Clostridia bacterium]|nr:glutamate--tRNA ligase [Clostridia bacterium]
MNEFEKMAELLLPDIQKVPADYEALYPPRSLPEGARVTRIAPSPTGYLHLGTLFASLVNRITATSSGGVFYTRIEDTDKKREIAGGIEDIIDGLSRFGISIDEGFLSGTLQSGDYAPYRQSERAEIYQTYAKDLIRQGLAYPCFCTAEELDAVRAEQEKAKERTGYHGKWARHRDISFEEAQRLVRDGRPYVIRLRSPGHEENKITFEDQIKGKIEMPENDEDFVLLKSDGIPTYHFAHAIDDHLMHTTHVLRGDEWISSVPKHLQLFRVLGFKPPKYGHIAPIMKLDGGAKRKISKRKDPEAAVRYFAEQGYLSEAVVEYLMTVASSDFEDWRRANPERSYREFKFNLKRMSVSGALFDGDKLRDVSKTILSRMKTADVYVALTDWAKEFDPAFFELLTRDQEYTKAILSIDREVPKPRKDLAKWSDAKDYVSYFFEETYTPDATLPDHLTPADAKAFLERYQAVYDPADDRQRWFEKIKEIAPMIGFSAETKQ